MRIPFFLAGLLFATEVAAVPLHFEGTLTTSVDGAIFGMEEDEVPLELRFRFRSFLGLPNASAISISIGGTTIALTDPPYHSNEGAAYLNNERFSFSSLYEPNRPIGYPAEYFPLINGYFPFAYRFDFLGGDMFPDDTNLVAENFHEHAAAFTYSIYFLQSVLVEEPPYDPFERLLDEFVLTGNSYDSFSISPAVDGFFDFGRGTLDIPMDQRVYPDSVPVIPLPAGAILLLTGLGALASGGILRRRAG